MKAAVILAFALAMQQQDTIRINVELEQMLMTVRHADGRIANDLNAEDFVVEEDGVRQTISHFALESDTKVSIGILIDNRRDFSDVPADWISPTFIPAALQSTREFLKVTRPGDEILLMTFHDSVEIEQAFTDNPAVIETRLNKIRQTQRGACKRLGCDDVRSKMNLSQAVDRALQNMGNLKNRKQALIVLTAADGPSPIGSRLNGTSTEFAEAAAHIRDAEIDIFGFGWQQTQENSNSEPPLSGLFNSLAAESGGRCLVVKSQHKPSLGLMADFLRSISTELHSQYRIGYYPQKRTSANPVINIRTTSMEYRVKAWRDTADSGLKR